jgi:hypothetical protein
MEALEAEQAAQQIKYPSELHGLLFDNVRGYISHQAMRKVMKQRKLLVPDAPACTGAFTISQGLPCAHFLEPFIQREESLQLRHFNLHWRLQRQGNPRILMPPSRVHDSITMNPTLPKTSTQREPCAFEAIERVKKPKAPPKCSVCGEIGHHMKSRACPLRYQHLLQPAPAEATQEGAIEPIGERSAAATAVREATATEIINNDNPRDTTANGAISGAAPETSALVQATAAKLLVLDSLTDDELLGILASSSSIDDEVEAPEVEAPEVEAPEVAVEPPRAPTRRVTRSSTQRPPQISMEEPRLPYDAPIAII